MMARTLLVLLDTQKIGEPRLLVLALIGSTFV